MKGGRKNDMDNTLAEIFADFRIEADGDSVAAAILVLAQVIDTKTVIDRTDAANIGHELALALKNVLSEGTLKVDVDGDIRTGE